MDREKEEKWLEKKFREAGLTEKQVEAGLKYYRNFCRPLDINVAKSRRMFLKNIKMMKESFKKKRW